MKMYLTTNTDISFHEFKVNFDFIRSYQFLKIIHIGKKNNLDIAIRSRLIIF